MKILVFPKDPNPYQKLLYEPLIGKATVSYLDLKQLNALDLFLFMPRLLGSLVLYRARGFRILHIHWLYTFRLPQRLPFSRAIAYVNTRIFLITARALGYKVVWTAHNILPHEALTSNDLKIRQILSRLADAIIVHSPSLLIEMSKVGLDIEHAHVIPIGTYSSFYLADATRSQARKKFGFKQSEIVLLFFGRIEGYKNVPALIGAFNELRTGNSSLRLIIAGNISNKSLRQEINLLKDEAIPGIIYDLTFISDNEVQYYFKAADVAVYPFKKVATSSAVILAMDFSLPVVAPRIGALADMPAGIGYFYDPHKSNALEESLKMATSNSSQLRQIGRRAKKYASTLSWDEIADQILKTYQDILSPFTNDRS